MSAVRSMLLRCRRDLARARGKGGWTAYYYPSGQSGPQEPLAQPPDQPPDEAYGRVTNPERFEPLHSAILEMISKMEETFDVVRVEGYGLDEELEGKRDIVRPTVQLTPVNSTAAPITVTFSDFPGLFVRFGRWVTEPFPSCGCDACDESAANEIERLTELVDIVTAGGFPRSYQMPQRTSRERCLAGISVPGTRISTLWQISHHPPPCPPNVRRSPPPELALAAMASPTGARRSLGILRPGPGFEEVGLSQHSLFLFRLTIRKPAGVRPIAVAHSGPP